MRIVLLLLALSLSASSAELKWPEITSEAKPWSRWWWLGSAANEREMSVQMEKYARAGLGGLEITPIYGVKGQEKEFRHYLTKPWNALFAHSLQEARRLGLGVDLATGNGWPFGGPWVTPQDSSKNVFHKTYTLASGQTLQEPVTHTQSSMVRAIGTPSLKIDQIKEPLSANSANLQQWALEQVRFEKPLPLVGLMAYSAAGQTLDLFSKVDKAGKLNWEAPQGAWTLYAVFQGWHGKMVERAGPGGEGEVIDHFSAKALADYLEYFDEKLKGTDLKGLRAFFNDSYEVDDASGESNWTPQFFEQFQKRRGYNLREHLPALFQKDQPEKNVRVLSDYRETLSDLLLDEFTRPWVAWANKQGAIVRNQAHGSPANLLDLYGASHIPETEGNDIIRFLFASSAAHVTGKRLASAEAATWLGEHFTSTLGDVKNAVDLFFLGGVNHICYHGTPYSPDNAAWPGSMFYASVHFGPTNSFWNDFPILNQYVARAQSFLQSGSPNNDVLLYYPVHDAYAEPGRRTVQHFDGEARGTNVRAAAEQLLAAGYSLDLISDRQLASAKASAAGITVGGVTYKALVIPQATYVPAETIHRMGMFAQAGATVIAHNRLPEKMAGFHHFEERERGYKQMISSLRFQPMPGASVVEVCALGSGRVLVGKDLRQALAAAGLTREAMVDRGLHFVRRALPDGHAYFVRNNGANVMEGWIPFSVASKGAGIYDPMTGRSGLAASRQTGGGTEVYLQLTPGASAIVRTYTTAVSADPFPYYKPSGPAQPLLSPWTLTFIEGGPQTPPTAKLAKPDYWTKLEGEAVKSFSGTGVYRSTFSKPALSAASYLLDLGDVRESARVRLNGKEVGALISKPFQVSIPASALEATNTLEVTVSNLMANRVADMDRRNVNYRNFYNTNFPARLSANRGPDGLFSAAKWTPRDSGLLGPVSLTPQEAFAPAPLSK